MITKLKSCKFIGIAFLTGIFMQLGIEVTHDLYSKINNRNKKEKKVLFRKLRKAK